MLRKILSAFLSAALIMTLAACSSGSGSEQGDNANSKDGAVAGEKNASKVTVFKSHLGKGVLPKADDPHVQYIKEKTGVEYELTTNPTGADPAEYLNVLIASDELPDILRPINGVEITLIQQGGALALDDLLPKYAPNVWKQIPEEAWNLARSASPDGKIYYVPKVFLVPERAAMVRQDWLDNLGLKMPKTQEEYVDMLRAFRDKDPNGNGKQDEIPTIGREFGTWMDHLFAMYGVAMWEGKPEWDLYDGSIQYAGVTNNMREAIKFIRSLYEEKLLDNETFLNKGDVWQAKIVNNLVGNWYHLPGSLKSRYDTMLKTDPKAYIAGLPLPEVKGFDGYITQKSFGEVEWLIPSSAKDNAPNALKLLDFFYNPENADFVRFGIEGQQHEVKDGKKVLLPQADDRTIPLGMLNFTDEKSMNDRLEETYPKDQADMTKAIFKVSVADAKRIAGDGMPVSVYEGFPDIQSHKLFQEYLAKIVIGEWPIEKFDEFVKKWKASGGDTVTQRAQEWFKKVQTK
ncbi:extracellular solute-binding protein [Paenibacillus solisilvae]|uniref:Extracellular solute-binding protein n=1 Tax=Paenibacillus solisilvae TaxID=2486751 RepID=A0ABW0W5A5_9BACL